MSKDEITSNIKLLQVFLFVVIFFHQSLNDKKPNAIEKIKFKLGQEMDLKL
jgi:hypothetical protein